MSKRLEMLRAVVERGGDPFAQYALALEYAKLSRFDDALATFTRLREQDPDYLPMYLMAGQMLLDLERYAPARDWLNAGIDLARRKADAKALSELEAALSTARHQV